jgi:hypothetical protein
MHPHSPNIEVLGVTCTAPTTKEAESHCEIARSCDRAAVRKSRRSVIVKRERRVGKIREKNNVL